MAVLLRRTLYIGSRLVLTALRRETAPIIIRLWRCSLHRKVVGAGLFLMASSIPVAQAASPEEQLPSALAHADQLYKENKMKEGLSYLKKYSHLENAEVLWKLARFCYKVGKYQSGSQEESQRLAQEAVRYGERSLAADSTNFACHKWMGIIISWSSEFEGYKRKIERSFEIKDHFEKAKEYNPRDATVLHLLGQWCYEVAAVPWYMRKAASWIFATPPSSSYEEALSHFENAEKVDPGFYSTNWLFLGKCHLQLGDKEKARKWLTKAAEYESQREDDLEAKKEAESLLRGL